MLHLASPISPSRKAAVLASFAADENNLSRFHTLLTYLIGSDRLEDARLFLDDSGQIVARTIEVATASLAKGGPSWIFDAVVERAPERAVLGKLSLPFVLFGAPNDAKLVHAVSRFISR